LTNPENGLIVKSHLERVERFAFYERRKSAYAVVMTGETVKYGNIIFIEEGSYSVEKTV